MGHANSLPYHWAIDTLGACEGDTLGTTRVAVCGSNGSIMNHATARMNHKLAHHAAFPSAFNTSASQNLLTK